jgi:hypothetical protein
MVFALRRHLCGTRGQILSNFMAPYGDDLIGMTFP